MDARKALAATMLTVMAAAAASPAWADRRGHHHHGGHVRFGIVLGAPLFWPHHHYQPYYPRTVVIREEPRTYIEKSDAPDASPSSSGYWYYCRSADMYYPYTQHCPGGWERVAPQPPGAP
jgi:hypothetical protein